MNSDGSFRNSSGPARIASLQHHRYERSGNRICKMRLAGKIVVFLGLLGLVFGEKEDEGDTSAAFMEAAQALFANKEAIGGLQGIASAFMQANSGKQVDDMLGGERSKPDGLGQILSGISTLMSGNKEGQGMDLSMIGTLLETFTGGGKEKARSNEVNSEAEGSGFDFESMLNIATMFLGQSGNAEGIMGLLPMVLDTFSGKSSAHGDGSHDHSGHSWYMPPILENIHLMWDHFSNSDLGQTLWKNSGLANIVGMMTDSQGRVQYEMLMESFENPGLRRRWIKSLTNFVAEWMSHISDPVTQSRYLSTVQFVGNSFLKSQGYPKYVMFDTTKPTESISRLINAVAKRHVNVKIDSYLYIKPAVAYIQELMNLASEKGFIMSRINAQELSHRLSDTINNDLISPLLKAYRAYKWGSSMPQCAAQILCTVNKKFDDGGKDLSFRIGLTKIASFPAAWAISNKSGLSFWSLYGAILESSNGNYCLEKYPVDCTPFHEEELRVTTESAHSEL